MFVVPPTITSKSSNPGLSLLSRGVGEEKKNNGHKKLEVCLEPEDYHNIQGKKFYLPPLQQQAWASRKEIVREVRAHKTYTTRKGALLLYAEDLAQTARDRENMNKKRSLEAEDSSYFNSINDLRSAILSYGNSGATQYRPEVHKHSRSEEAQPFLGFVHDKRAPGPCRTVRPGFSAKRYLANWSRSWDDSILNYLRSEGHIWDKNLFQQNVLSPNLYRRINDDLSLIPLPYRVTRTMLVSPGQFESLEFYRIRPDSAGLGIDEEDGYEADTGEREGEKGDAGDGKGKRPHKRARKQQATVKTFNMPGSIAMIVRDMEQKPHAMQYQDLQETQQREVLQRLLLQSALHQHQHLRKIKEEQESRKGKEEEEEEDGQEKGGGDQKQGFPVGIKGLGSKNKRTDTSMTQYGSPPMVIPEAGAVDMETAISNLITSNSANILGGSKAFTDQTIVEMYQASRVSAMRPAPPPPSSTPSHSQHSSRRKVMSNSYPSNFSGTEPLPPIQNSLGFKLGGGDNTLWPVPPSKESNGPPVITMEPPTPQHPQARLGGTLKGSRLTQSWSSQTKSESSVMSSSESNIWRADVDEDHLLQQEEAEQQRAASDQEEWTKSPRSQKEALSKASSIRSRQSAASKAGSIDIGPALSINSHLSRSLENLSPSQDQTSQFPTGRKVPSRLQESMRSHKSSARSAAGSVALGGLDGDFVVMGSKKGSDYAPSVASQLDRDEFPTPDMEGEEEQADGQALEGQPPPGHEEAKSIKLGQGIIDLPMSEAPGAGSVRDHKSLASKKSSLQGSIKAESIVSSKGPGDLDAMQSFKNFSYQALSRKSSILSLQDLASDQEEDDWPLQANQSQAGSRTSEVEDANKKIESESEVEISVEDVDADDVQEEVKSGSRTSSLLEPPPSVSGSIRTISRAQSIESQMEQLVEAASVVVDQIMQSRPLSGRDLAEDAKMAAELWSSKLGDLFAEDTSGPDRVRSAPYHRHRNSLDTASVTSSMLEEPLDHRDRTSPMSSRRMRKIRRIHSAEAAVSLLRYLLKDEKPGDGSLGFGVTNLGVAEKAEREKKAALVRPPVVTEKAVDEHDAKLNEELAKIVQETGLLEKKGKSKKGGSTKSSKKSEGKGEEEGGSPGGDKEKDAFVVGMPKENKADILLYKPVTPEPKEEEPKPKPPPKEKKKIQKKQKKAPAVKPEKPKKGKKKGKSVSSKSSEASKEDEDARSKAESEKKGEEDAKEEEEGKEGDETKDGEGQDEFETEEARASPESPEFIFIHDEFSDSDEEDQPAEPAATLDDIQLEPRVSAVPSEDFSEFTDFTEDSTSQGPSSISRSQAKAFKRAAEAEKRKAAVEKKRKEREEAKRKAQEEAERAERIKLEFEEEKKRKEQEAKDRLERAALERERLAREEEERNRQAALRAEHERKQQAEYKRKMEEMAKKKREEDEKRRAEEERLRKEEEERKRIEAEMLAEMEEAERLEYEKRRRAEELEAQRLAEEERIRREIEEKIADEQARIQALEMAKKQKELEARLRFNKDLQSEANVFAHSQEMTRAFTWSYFELLEHLGIDIPDFLKDHYKEIAESK